MNEPAEAFPIQEIGLAAAQHVREQQTARMANHGFYLPIYMSAEGQVVLVCRDRGHTEHSIFLHGPVRRRADRACARDIITSLSAAVMGNRMYRQIERELHGRRGQVEGTTCQD